MKVTNTTATVTEALNVMNQALRQHKDSLPYKQIIAAADKVLPGHNIGVAVYRDDPDTPHDFYTIEWRDGQLNLLEHGKDEPEITWKTPQSYFEDVVENKEDYIAHPAKLDFDWLRKRVGI
jgi:hypothetical protein